MNYDRTIPRLWRDPSGSQHDEQRGGILPFGLRNLPADEAGVSKATIHKTIYERYVAGPVVVFDKLDVYRPKNLFCDVDFAQCFDGSRNPQPVPNPQCVADDIELKWEEETGVYLWKFLDFPFWDVNN